MTAAGEMVLALVGGCEAAARRRLVLDLLARYPRPSRLLYVAHCGLYKAAWVSGLTVDEINAECLYGVVLAAGKYDPARGSFQACATNWMRSAVSHAVRRWRRSEGYQFFDAATDHGDAEDGAALVPARPDPDPDAAEEAATLLRVLDDKRRRAVEMHHGRYLLREIAAELGVCKSRAKQLRDEGLAALRRQANRRAT